jgi:hypothetical protein
MATTFHVTDFTTAQGKKVLSYNPTYSKEVLDTVTDASGRIWSLVSTTYEGKTKLAWNAEDADFRLTMPGTMSADEVIALADIKAAAQFAIAQSKSVELVLD